MSAASSSEEEASGRQIEGSVAVSYFRRSFQQRETKPEQSTPDRRAAYRGTAAAALL